MRRQIHLDGMSQDIKGQQWQAADVLRIGRDPGSDAVLSDRSVSWHHAEIHDLGSKGWFVRDLGSTNGTYVNGVAIGSKKRRIEPHDLVQVGNAVLRVAAAGQAGGLGAESVCDTMQVEATALPLHVRRAERFARRAPSSIMGSAELSVAHSS